MLNVPLLPAPVKSIRDAARAVKRLAGQVIQTVTETTLSQFLDLPEFRVFGYALEDQGEVRIIHLYLDIVKLNKRSVLTIDRKYGILLPITTQTTERTGGAKDEQRQ
jgi:hypothetical protein